MADGAASRAWPSPLHDVLASYKNAESAVKELTKDINDFLKILRSDEKLSERRIKMYEESLQQTRLQLNEARDERDNLKSFYAVLSPISETLDDTYRHIRDNPRLFLEPVPVFTPEGKFAELFRPDVGIPLNLASGSPAPDFLTHDLLGRFNENFKNFDEIVSGNHQTLMSFYGTSGAGKTRLIFEIFARSYGLYFVAADSATLNPGSSDIASLYFELGRFVKESTPLENGELANFYTIALIFCRLLVFCALKHALGTHGKVPSEELWLRVQLAPRYYFAGDVFNALFSTLISGFNEDLSISNAAEEPRRILKKLKPIWRNIRDLVEGIKFNVAFDETQVLAKKFVGFFHSSEDQDERRSLLSPVSKTLTSMVDTYKLINHPIFSGTGFSMVHITTQLSSASAKDTKNPSLHYKFPSLGTASVEQYIGTILDLDQLNEHVVQYTCKWLTGRPRWTVAFLDILLGRELQSSDPEDLNTSFIQEIRRFVEIMTHPNAFDTIPENQRESRASWRYKANSTALTAIKRINQNKKKIQDFQDFLDALVTHLFTDKPVCLKNKSAQKLVDDGVCQVSSVTVEASRRGYVPDGFFVKLDEPLVLEAALQNFLKEGTLLEFVVSKIRETASQDYMEYYTMLCAFKHMNSTLDVAKQIIIQDHSDRREMLFDHLEMPKRSSFGKLVRNCSRDQQGTLKWLSEMNGFASEGLMDLVEPFCYPFDDFGADVITMMRRTTVPDLASDEAFVPVLMQVKYPNRGENEVTRREQNKKALLSVFPDLAFRAKRAKFGGCNGEQFPMFHWTNHNKRKFLEILSVCKDFFRVDELNYDEATPQRRAEADAECAYIHNIRQNQKEEAKKEREQKMNELFKRDLDWRTRRRPVIMMVCQTEEASDFLTSFLSHSREKDGPRLIAESDSHELSQRITRLHCQERNCEREIHDIVLSIDARDDNYVAHAFFSNSDFITIAQNAVTEYRGRRLDQR